uniref:A-kinase anchor protein 7-like phosphoesterase domain-containing protein n=1 Tax=Acrobeloides nanus TaxID=290746 RepID=A0A914DBS4_9BILA
MLRIQYASLALDEVAGIYDMDHSKLNVKFKGISSFGKESLYAAIEEESKPDLLDLYEVVKTVFNSYGIPTWTWFSQFQPHMTLAYLEPNEQKTLGPKWDKLKNASFEFGIESVKSIQLCNITIDGSIHDYKILFDAELFSK